jgi:hypothetical protein
VRQGQGIRLDSHTTKATKIVDLGNRRIHTNRVRALVDGREEPAPELGAGRGGGQVRGATRAIRRDGQEPVVQVVGGRVRVPVAQAHERGEPGTTRSPPRQQRRGLDGVHLRRAVQQDQEDAGQGQRQRLFLMDACATPVGATTTTITTNSSS